MLGGFAAVGCCCAAGFLDYYLWGRHSYLIYFSVGILLLALVLFVPAMESLFLVSPLNGFDLLCVLGLAFAPTLLIQLTRIFQGR